MGGARATMVNAQARAPAQIRAALPLQSLRVLEQLVGPELGQVVERLRPATAAALREASWHEWLPLDHDLELSETVAAVLGPEVDRERARLCIAHNLATPLLRPFVAGAELVFGRAPAMMLATVPRGFNAIYRGAGQVRYEVAEGLRRRLIYEDVPSAMFATRCYFEAIAGALESIFALCGIEGTVGVSAIDVEGRVVEFLCVWEGLS